METKIKDKETRITNDILDHETITKSNENTVIVQTEWNKNGDCFKQFSLYDDSYMPIVTFGETTLIENYA